MRSRLRNWFTWKRVVLALSALVVIMMLTPAAARGTVLSLLILLAAIAVVPMSAAMVQKSTPIRLAWSIGLVAVFWLVLYFYLLPAVSKASAAGSQFVQPIAVALSPVESLDTARRAYLAIAASVPLLFFLFGAGPFSQHGAMAVIADEEVTPPPTDGPAATGSSAPAPAGNSAASAAGA